MVTGDVAGRLPPQSLQRWAGSSGTWEGGRVWLRTESGRSGSQGWASQVLRVTFRIEWQAHQSLKSVLHKEHL